jgi:hypothetical protein
VRHFTSRSYVCEMRPSGSGAKRLLSYRPLNSEPHTSSTGAGRALVRVRTCIHPRGVAAGRLTAQTPCRPRVADDLERTWHIERRIVDALLANVVETKRPAAPATTFVRHEPHTFPVNRTSKRALIGERPGGVAFRRLWASRLPPLEMRRFRTDSHAAADTVAGCTDAQLYRL